MKAVKDRYAKKILQPTEVPADIAVRGDVATASGIRPLNWFEKSRYGFFSHYAFGGTGSVETRFSDGTAPVSLDALANAFDANRFAADVAAFGVEYVTITAWHYAMYALYPSAVMNAILPGHATTSRDVIADLIVALKPYGIKLMLYIHLTDGGDLQAAEQTATGWNDATNGYAAWNTFIANLVTECSNRYGQGVDGYWVDMVQGADWSKINATTLAPALYAGNPNRVVVGNQGTSDDTAPDKARDFGITHRSREYNPRPNPLTTATPGYDQTLALAAKAGLWWAQVPKTGANQFGSVTEQFRFVVLQAGTNKNGGGMVWNAGNYAGSDTSLWEPGIEAGLKGVAALIAPIAASLKGVRRSTSFPTPNTVTLASLPNGFVATQSLDGHTEYIHVLTAPGTSTITLPTPADGATNAFVSGRNLATKRAVTVVPVYGGGYKVTLDPADSWSATDTVIALDRQIVVAGVSPSQVWIGPTQWLTNNTATLTAQAAGSRFAGWTMGPDTSTQIQTTLTIPPDWNTFDVDIYWSQPAGAPAGGVYLIPYYSQVSPGSSLALGDSAQVNIIMAAPGTTDALQIKTLLRRLSNVRSTLNHFRIQRFATHASDTAGTIVFLGALLRRTS